MSETGFKCEFCNAILLDKYSADAEAWDWFTGYLPETHHFCPHCVIQHQATIIVMRMHSLVPVPLPPKPIEKIANRIIIAKR